jgi:ribonucleotide reductase alpha subunit
VAFGCRRPKALAELPEDERYGVRNVRQQVFDRLAGTWTYWGWKGGYFSTEEDARAFFDEMRYMLATQMARPTPRSGSTPACTGPMASTAPARATTMSISRPAS